MESSTALEESLLSKAENGKVVRTNDLPVTDDSSGSDDGVTLLSTQSEKRASRPSVLECLGVPEKETTDLELDVYNMFYICTLWTQPFFYSLAVLVTKMALYIILIIDLFDPESYPFDHKKQGVEIKTIVMLTQFFLLPVAIVIQEELMLSFFIFGNLQYSPGIIARHPNAYRWKYYLAHSLRALDGLMFLGINASLMLNSANLLSIFLNFAALMFLQTIDNIALKVCLDGYWTRSLQECAQDVVDMRIAFKQKYKLQCLRGRTSVLWVGCAYIVLVFFWVKVNFIDQ